MTSEGHFSNMAALEMSGVADEAFLETEK